MQRFEGFPVAGLLEAKPKPGFGLVIGIENYQQIEALGYLFKKRSGIAAQIEIAQSGGGFLLSGRQQLANLGEFAVSYRAQHQRRFGGLLGR